MRQLEQIMTTTLRKQILLVVIFLPRTVTAVDYFITHRGRCQSYYIKVEHILKNKQGRLASEGAL